jgi:hypothetical protein
MKIVIGLCILILIELIVLATMMIRKRGRSDKSKENFANPYMITPNVPSDLTTCKRCKPLGDIYNGYQTAPEPPAAIWHYTNSDPDNRKSTSNSQNYARMSSELQDDSPTPCTDAYRCRKFGVATGVQGKIF